jgi:dihydrofolate reductase
MRKVVAGLFVSLDGVVESPERWNGPYQDAEMGEAIGAQVAASDTLLLGRRTYEEFAAFWPSMAGSGDPIAEYLNEIPKLVASTTLTAADWTHAQVIEGDVVEALRALKQRPGKNISITGSATLVRSLLPSGVIDELGLMIHPLVVGRGKRLFTDTEAIGLTLIDTAVFSSGVVSVTYAPEPAAVGSVSRAIEREEAS